MKIKDFTIIEWMLVASILGIIAAVVIPAAIGQRTHKRYEYKTSAF